jgi:hypothetical protein
LLKEVATLGGSDKSKVYGDDGMDEHHGLTEVLWYYVNMGNESSNTKLVNEVIYQLDSLKKEGIS